LPRPSGDHADVWGRVRATTIVYRSSARQRARPRRRMRDPRQHVRQVAASLSVGITTEIVGVVRPGRPSALAPTAVALSASAESVSSGAACLAFVQASCQSPCDVLRTRTVCLATTIGLARAATGVGSSPSGKRCDGADLLQSRSRRGSLQAARARPEPLTSCLGARLGGELRLCSRSCTSPIRHRRSRLAVGEVELPCAGSDVVASDDVVDAGHGSSRASSAASARSAL